MISLKNIKLYYAFNLAASLMLQLVALILVYLLSPEEYGYYALITSVAQIMYILCSGWNNATVLNLGTKAFKETGTYKDIIVYRAYVVVVCFVIISSVFLVSRASIAKFVGSDINSYLVFVFFFGNVCYDFVSQIFYPGDKNLLQSIAVFTTNFIILLYVVFFVHDIKSYIFFNSSAHFLLFAILILLFIYYFGKDKFVFKIDEFKHVLQYSFWQLFGVIGVYLINLGTNYVLRFYHVPISDIGLYNFAYKLFSGFLPLFALCGVVIPKWVYEPSISNINKYLFNRLVPFYIFIQIVYLAIYFILPLFLKVIAKTDYMASVDIYIMLFGGFIFMSLNQLLNPIILNSPFYKHSQYSAIIQGAILLISSLFLVGKYGITGAIYANVLGFVVGTSYSLIIYRLKVYPFLNCKMVRGQGELRDSNKIVNNDKEVED